MNRMIPVLFILLPLAEIALLVEVGGHLGLWPTLGLIIGSAVLGLYLMRHQGLAALARIQHQGIPLAALLDRFSFILAGLLLLLPGFITDFLGLLLLLPLTRSWIAGKAQANLKPAPDFPQGPATDSAVIDGEYEVLTPDDDGDAADGCREERSVVASHQHQGGASR